jgi:ADP-ribose pyrophosphatase YjhB (NUDIX family)
MTESLFGETVNRKIMAYDLEGNKHEKDLTDFKFRASVYGILLDGKKILLQRHPLTTKFGLPGGGIELGETISDCLEREFKEETGLTVRVKDLVGATQDFFTHEEKFVHSIVIVYKVEKVGGELGTNDEDSAEVKYFDLSELNENKIQRLFWPIIEKIRR